MHLDFLLDDDSLDRRIAEKIWNAEGVVMGRVTKRGIKGSIRLALELNIFPKLTSEYQAIRWWDLKARRAFWRKWIGLATDPSVIGEEARMLAELNRRYAESWVRREGLI